MIGYKTNKMRMNKKVVTGEYILGHIDLQRNFLGKILNLLMIQIYNLDLINLDVDVHLHGVRKNCIFKVILHPMKLLKFH